MGPLSVPAARVVPSSAPAGSTLQNESAPGRHCRVCGTEVTDEEDLCPWCARKPAAEVNWRELALHWLVFLAVMIALFGGAALFFGGA